MPAIRCGATIRYPNFERGTAGCLLRFTDKPDQVLLLTAGHVVLPSSAKQNDAIFALDIPDRPLGALRTWSNFQDNPTADAALIWVDPALILPQIIGLPDPAGFNLAPRRGDTLRICPAAGQATPREIKVERIDDIDFPAPNWNTRLTYTGQLVCSPAVTNSGDSGAIALDDSNRIAGMVIGGSMDDGLTYVTPVASILSNSAWHGGQLELLTKIPAGAVAPTASPLAPNLAAKVAYGSLVPNGFFSADPYDLTVARSVRTNNPGALNCTLWQTTRPGFIGQTEPDGSSHHNRTTIYRTPEHGIASWFHLIGKIYGFEAQGSFTLRQLAQRYAGQETGSAVDTYVAGWSAASGGTLTSSTAISLDDDQQTLSLARAMYQHEAGRPSPLHDDQISFAVAHERNGTLPV